MQIYYGAEWQSRVQLAYDEKERFELHSRWVYLNHDMLPIEAGDKLNPEKCSILGPLVSRTVDGTWGKESVVQYSYNLRQDMGNDYMGRAYRSHDLQDLLCTKAHHILLVVKLDHDWNSGPSICDCATVTYGLKRLLRVPFPLHAGNSLMSNSYVEDVPSGTEMLMKTWTG